MPPEKITVKLPSGIEVSGTREQVEETAKKLGVSLGGDGVFYMSGSQGLLRISDMSNTHIINAMRKIHRTWAESLPTDTKPFLTAVRSGLITNVTYMAMLNELARRERESSVAPMYIRRG